MRDTKFSEQPEKRNSMSDTGKRRSGGNVFAGEVALKIGPKGRVGFQPTAFTGRGNSMSKELKPNKSLQSLSGLSKEDHDIKCKRQLGAFGWSTSSS